MQWVLLWACIFLLLFLPLLLAILGQSTLLHTHRQLVDYLGRLPPDLPGDQVREGLIASGFDERVVRFVAREDQAILLDYVCPLTKRTRALRVLVTD